MKSILSYIYIFLSVVFVYSAEESLVGKRIIFLEKEKEFQKYGYSGYRFENDKTDNIPYEKIVGKVATIIAIKETVPQQIILELDGIKKEKIIRPIFSERINLNYVGFLSELDDAKKLFGKKYWNKKGLTLKINNSTEVLKAECLSGFTLVDAKWGTDSEMPIKFYLKSKNGKLYFWEGSMSSINDSQNVFAEHWYSEDPYKKYPNWKKEDWESIKKEEVVTGMTKDMVLMSWGKPKQITKVGKKGEQWIYGNIEYGFGKIQYLVFENDILLTIREE